MTTLLWTLGLFIAVTIGWNLFVWAVNAKLPRKRRELDSPPQRFIDEYRRHRSS